MVWTGKDRLQSKAHVVDELHIHNKVIAKGTKLMVAFPFFKYNLLPSPSHKSIGFTTQQTKAAFVGYFVIYHHPPGSWARKSRRLADVCPIYGAVHGKFIFRNTIIYSQQARPFRKFHLVHSFAQAHREVDIRPCRRQGSTQQHQFMIEIQRRD